LRPVRQDDDQRQGERVVILPNTPMMRSENFSVRLVFR